MLSTLYLTVALGYGIMVHENDKKTKSKFGKVLMSILAGLLWPYLVGCALAEDHMDR